MNDCIFCKIVKGEIPSHKVYEDDNVLAFLDANPVSDGHTLVIHKEHHDYMENTPDEILSKVFVVCKKLMSVLKRAMNADYIVVSVVGVDIPHFHVHLMPRKHKDGLKTWPTKQYQEGEGEKIAQKIKENL